MVLRLQVTSWLLCVALGALFGVGPTRCLANGGGALEHHAERFVSLALSLARQRPEELDAYFGPPRPNARDSVAGQSLSALQTDVQNLRADIEASSDTSSRKVKLLGQVRALGGLLEVLNDPGPHTFDSEAWEVYGMTPSSPDREKSDRALQALERLLPGPGILASRVAAFRNGFVVPPERRKAVFERALSECRARTLAKWHLREGERLNIEWTREVDSAWHRYEGHGRSTLRLNPAAVAYLSSAIDVACHEGYPGHHAQFVVMEAHAGPRGVAVEDTVVLLRSPVSMLREGAASYGVELAFPPAERLAFERDVLFPLAGLDPAQAAKHEEVNRLVDQLSANVAPIVRDYRDARLPRPAALRALESSALIASPESLLRFADRFGPYVLGYTAARDEVHAHIETRRRQSAQDPWRILHTLLADPSVALLGRPRSPEHRGRNR